MIEAAEGRLRLVIVDRDRSRGGGIAYGRARAGERMNVRARDLSIFHDRPGDFAEWMASLLGDDACGAPGLGPSGAAGADLATIADSFAPRAMFANYVRRRLAQTVAAHPHVTLETLEREARRISPAPGGGFSVTLNEGPELHADAVALATGYGDPQPRFGRSPHEPIAPRDLAGLRRVALIGAGLTMADVLLRLRADGCEAQVEVISRRALAPRAHAETAARPPALRTPAGVRLADLLRDLRAATRAAEAAGRPWQGEVNRLRPHAQHIWHGLTEEDRARFMRHLRPFWDAHRHRLPPAQHERLTAELARPRTRLRAGRILSASGEAPCRLRVAWRGERGIASLDVDLAIDCSGHRPDLSSPLLAGLIEQRLAAPDPAGVGLRVSADGRLWRPEGGDVSGLFALGPLGQGSLFEITAVPEIARQAALAAQTLRDLLSLRGAAPACAAQGGG